MRLAVFTSEFPSRVSTFFARDVRGLIDAGAIVDVFPLYPVDENLWRYVPDVLGPSKLPRERVHGVAPSRALRPRPASARRPGVFLADAGAALAASVAGGVSGVAKTGYALAKTWAWAGEPLPAFDHVLAYWGNYAATAAMTFRRQTGTILPFSLFLHAGTDLYRRPLQLRRKLEEASRVIVVCEFNRRYVLDLFPDLRASLERKLCIHHPGLDMAGTAFTPSPRPSASLLGVGSLVRAKGFHHLIDALAVLRREGIDASLTLVGDGPEAAALEALARRLGVVERVSFRGWLTAPEVEAEMGRATVLVHPSSGLGDAVPTVIKEAMAIGTPVVASAVAGIPELLDEGRCGVLVPPRDPRSLAGAIGGLLRDGARREELVRAARARAESLFDLWKNGRRLLGRLAGDDELRGEGSSRPLQMGAR